MIVGDPILNQIVPGLPRCVPPRSVAADCALPHHRDVASPPRTSRPGKSARAARALSLCAWLAVGAVIGGLLAITAERSDGATTYAARPECIALRPVVARHFPAAHVERALAVSWRETACGRVLHRYNARTKDNSYGPMMVNRWGRLGAVYERAGFTAAEMATVDGGLAAAAWLQQRCDWGPWVKPYGCRRG